MVEILTWIFAGSTASVAIALVWVLLYFIWPMAHSPGKHFVRARRDGRPVFILDDGPIYRLAIGNDKASKDEEILRAGDRNDVIKKGPGSLKYCEGVLMGVGENFRSFLANMATLDLIEMINEKGWKTSEVQERITKLQEHLRRDLNITDEFQELKKKHDDELRTIKAEFDNKRAEVVEEHTLANQEQPEAQEETG